MLQKHKRTQAFEKEKKNKGKYFFPGKVGYSGACIVLVGHTLQQGNVVSFQHDPPWETERGENKV